MEVPNLEEHYQYNGNSLVLNVVTVYKKYRVLICSNTKCSTLFSQSKWGNLFYQVYTTDGRFIYEADNLTKELAEQIVNYIIRHDKLSVFK